MKYPTILKTGFFILAILNFSSTFASSLEHVELQLSLDINWTTPPGSDAILLGAYGPNDTWTVRIKFFDVSILEEDCEELICPAEIFASETGNSTFSIMIDSTTNPDENHPAVFYDAILSRDTFSFLSDSSREEFTFKDRANGLHEPESGTGLHAWTLDRSVSSLPLNPGTIDRTSEGFLQFLSGDNQVRVEEIFLNNIHQVSYVRSGVAEIASVQVVGTSHNPVPAECEYLVTQEWDEGFTANVRIKNISQNPIDGWRINLKFEDFIRIDHAWGALITGIPPFHVAKSASWNSHIPAGEEVSFGFVASKAASQSSMGTIESIICQ